MPFTLSLSSPIRRLYLNKEGEGIYIDNCNLPPHQRDGIRFIYNQFHLKNPGIILNDPSGHGKRLQVMLFIKAVKQILEDPVLIICNEHNADNWLKHFETWTDFVDDVCIENSNPYKKKFVIINTMTNLQMFTNRQRSVIIVDSDIITKELMKISYKCDYKIWVTSAEMKKDLELFSNIYSWIYPNEKVEIDKFKADENDPFDCIKKTILFDAFTEDIVKRSEGFATPFSVQKKPSPPAKKSKKKDITGTKIKQTKRKIEDYDDLANNDLVDDSKLNHDIQNHTASKRKNIEVEHGNDVTIKTDQNNDGGDESKMDVDNFLTPLNSKVKIEVENEASSTATNSVNLFETDELNTHHNITSGNKEVVSADNDLLKDVVKDECAMENAILDNKNEESEVNENVSMDEQCVESVCETKDHKDIDSIMKEYEDKVNDKFKGSILDSLF